MTDEQTTEVAHLNGAAKRPDPTNIVQALARCIAEMPAIGKDQTMGGGSQSYNYRSIEAITSHASVLFGRYGIVPKPHKITREVKEIRMGSGSSIWTEDTLTVVYRLYGPGGSKDYLTTAGFVALARDNSDKGTNKALTQAFKQMLLQVLVIGDNKDDPDSYSPAAGQPERVAPPTPEEWATSVGWQGKAEMDDAKREAREALKVRVDAGELTREAGNEAWKVYGSPEGPESPPGPRTKAEHDEWWAQYISGQAPEADETPATAPESGSEPPDGPEPPAIATEAPTDPDELPADNGYRDELDDVLVTAGVDAMMAALGSFNFAEVTVALVKRGDRNPVAGDDVDSQRRRLGSVLVRNKNAVPVEAKRSKSKGKEGE